MLEAYPLRRPQAFLSTVVTLICLFLSPHRTFDVVFPSYYSLRERKKKWFSRYFDVLTHTRSKDKSYVDEVNLELTKRAFFYNGRPFLMIVCSFVHKEATLFIDCM